MLPQLPPAIVQHVQVVFLTFLVPWQAESSSRLHLFQSGGSNPAASLELRAFAEFLGPAAQSMREVDLGAGVLGKQNGPWCAHAFFGASWLDAFVPGRELLSFVSDQLVGYRFLHSDVPPPAPAATAGARFPSLRAALSGMARLGGGGM